jgi:hypothetical protein
MGSVVVVEVVVSKELIVVVTISYPETKIEVVVSKELIVVVMISYPETKNDAPCLWGIAGGRWLIVVLTINPLVNPVTQQHNLTRESSKWWIVVLTIYLIAHLQ